MKQKGFSAIELMIAVAILGVLAAIAVPNYQRMVARSRQGEAKIDLANIFGALSVFRQERGSYSLCLWQAGYRPLAGAKRYYSSGFLNPVGSCLGTSCWTYDFKNIPNRTCSNTSSPFDGAARNDATFGANAFANASLPADVSAALSANTDSYLAGAWGSISRPSTIHDFWTIDEQKNVRQVQDGTH